MSVAIADLRDIVKTIPLDVADGDLAPFTTVAALIRSEDLAGSGLSSGRLDQIELYLAAHFLVLAVENGGLLREKQGQSIDQYRDFDKSFAGLMSTRYGQAALSLDSSGTLQSTMSTKKAQFRVVRSVQPPCNRTG